METFLDDEAVDKDGGEIVHNVAEEDDVEYFARVK